MPNFKLNLIKFKEEIKTKSGLYKFLKVAVSFLIILILAFLVFTRQTNFTNESIIENFSGFNLFSSVASFFRGQGRELIGEKDNRINILLMGIGGGEHDGPNLTDTMILASIEPSTKNISLLSIPRDLLVPIPGYGWRKINSANAFGEVNNPGRGGDLAKETTSQVFDIDIPYYAVIDFSAFNKIINDVGGVKVYVDEGFTDTLYPDENFGYAPITFEQGWQIMDGDRALKFVRSRHSTGGEGSDFARSKRQQKVIVALKEKVISLNFLMNPKNIGNLLTTMDKHVRTNLDVWQIIHLYELEKNIDAQKIVAKTLEAEPAGPLVSSLSAGAFVLRPRTGNWEELRDLVKNVFNQSYIEEAKAKSQFEEARVLIQNGTKINGLASAAGQLVRSLGYEVVDIGNAPNQDYEQTIIYDLTLGQKPNTLAILKNRFDAETKAGSPIWLNKANNATIAQGQADLLVILGKNNSFTIK